MGVLKKGNFLLLAIFFVCFTSCQTQIERKLFLANDAAYQYSGRVAHLSTNETTLIGAASSVSVQIQGDSAEVYVRGGSMHNYVTLVADGAHLGRFRIDTLSNFKLPVTFPVKAEVHDLEIVKATEASSGPVLFKGVKANGILPKALDSDRKKIEFIGNSITCGAAMDDEFSPCGEGDYLDHHNAYLSYGPNIARALDVDYMLSSISGWGIYRGWNSEEEEKHAVPEVYQNTYLNGEGEKPWDFTSYVPDVVSICLGTNDLSLGDGVKERLPFDEDLFVERYIAFIETIYGYYPDVQIGLLSSPMISGDTNTIFVACLERVVSHFNDKDPEKPIQLFTYDKLYVNGCSYHPGIQDHREMADALIPFYETLLKSN